MSTAADSPLSLAHYYLPVYRPRQVVLERGLLTESELDDIFSVQNLMYPVYKAKRYTDENEQ